MIMKINTNRWNKIRYTLYSRGYDLVGRSFNKSRKKSIESLALRTGDKVLLIGAGTGLDLEFIPSECDITATDITPSMIRKIQRSPANSQVKAIVMDGQCLDFSDNIFDAVILHLILAVIPDPVKCIKETERVLKPGGQVAVYDKFLPKERQLSLFRRFANVFTNLFFTDITRDFESIVRQSGLKVLSDVDAGLNGNLRLIKLKKAYR
jgi:phosphatidylethanolamine/phosphatidyl-N-methylethanolamine N-methyltransferase